MKLKNWRSMDNETVNVQPEIETIPEIFASEVPEVEETIEVVQGVTTRLNKYFWNCLHCGAGFHTVTVEEKTTQKCPHCHNQMHDVDSEDGKLAIAKAFTKVP